MDPYTLAPLGADPVCLAALQARTLLEKTDHTEREMAEVAAHSRRNAKDNEFAQLSGDFGKVDVPADKHSNRAEPSFKHRVLAARGHSVFDLLARQG